MDTHRAPNLDHLPLEAEEQIDAICLRFEQAWQTGPCPSFRPYLAEVPDEWRAALLRELLRLDLEYRQARGESPGLKVYLAAYPELAPELPAAFPPPPFEESLPTDLDGAVGVVRAPGAPPARVGRFQVVRELGRGGMGVVYEAVQAPLGRRVALKVLASRLAGDSEVERFRREAAAAARLHHTNIVPIFEAGQDGDVCYYAMQYIPGLNLSQFIEEAREPRAAGAPAPRRSSPQPASLTSGKDDHTADEKCPPTAPVPLARECSGAPWPDEELAGPAYFRRVAEIGLQAASALAYAHDQGIIHRDVKPGNLLLDARGTVWVADFGLVKTSDSELTSSDALLGTFRYLSPERLSGTCDARADVYSLGLTLYELATLRPGFSETDHFGLLEAISHREPASPRRLEPRIPRDLETIVLKAIQKAPQRRYQRAADMAEDLRRYLAGEPVRARRTRMAERAWLWARRHPLSAFLLTLLLLAILFVTASALWVAQQAIEHAAQLEVSEGAAQRAEQNARDALRNAEEERDGKDRALRRAEGLRLLAQSELVRPQKPALALLLAVEAAGRAPGLLANNAMQDALDECRELRVFRGHQGPVFSVSLSADGSKVLTCSEDGTARVWEASESRLRLSGSLESAKPQAASATDSKPLHVLPEKDVVQAHFSPDGRRVVTLAGGGFYRRFAPFVGGYGPLGWGTQGPRASLWDVATGQALASWQLPRPPGACWVVYSAGAVFSPDSRRVVTFFAISPGGYPLVHDVATGRQVALLQGHTPVIAAAFSPDNRTIATASTDNTVSLWEAETGRLLRTLTGHKCSVGAVSFSADGRRLLTLGTGRNFVPRGDLADSNPAEDDAAGRVWDVEGQQLAALAWPGPERTACLTGQLTPDGRHVVLADAHRGLRLWNAATGAPEPVGNPTRLEWPELGADPRVALGRDGSSAVITSVDRAAHVLAGQDLLAFRGHDAKVEAAAFSSDGRQLVTASADGTARLWGVPAPGFPRPERPRSWWPTYVSALRPDGGRLFVCQNAFPRGSLIDTATDRVYASYDNFLYDAVFIKGGREVLVVGSKPESPLEIGDVDVLDAATGKRLCTTNGLPGRFLAASADGRLMLLGPRAVTPGFPPDGPAVVWDLAAGKKTADLAANVQPATTAAFSPDGRLVTLMNANTGLAEVWDAATGKERRQVREKGQLLMWAGYFEGGRKVLGFYVDNAAMFRAFDACTGEQTLTLTDRTLRPADLPFGFAFPSPRVRLFHVSSDGRRLLCSPYRNVVGLWDVGKGGEPDVALRNHTGEVTCVRFGPDERTVVTGSEDRTARLWDADTGRELAVFKGHDAAVTCAALDAAGKRLVTAGLDRTVRVWDVRTGEELARLRWQNEFMQDVAFTPDGRRVVVRGPGLTQLWDLDILAVAQSRLPRTLTEEERRRYEIPVLK